MIEIRPPFNKEQKEWDVKFDNTDKEDRMSCKEYMSQPLGFFYYPRKWGVEKRFQVLKDDMIRRRQKEVDHLLRDIESIKNTKLPDWVKD